MDRFRKRTLGNLLDEAAENYGDREALIFGKRAFRQAKKSSYF